MFVSRSVQKIYNSKECLVFDLHSFYSLAILGTVTADAALFELLFVESDPFIGCRVFTLHFKLMIRLLATEEQT